MSKDIVFQTTFKISKHLVDRAKKAGVNVSSAARWGVEQRVEHIEKMVTTT